MIAIQTFHGVEMVRATLVGRNIAVSRRWRVNRDWAPVDGYTLTHVPTGFALAIGVKTRTDALSLARKLQRRFSRELSGIRHRDTEKRHQHIREFIDRFMRECEAKP